MPNQLDGTVLVLLISERKLSQKGNYDPIDAKSSKR